MSELPFSRPLQFEHLCFSESMGDGHWFVFCGDRLLVEMGPPSAGPTDDLRVKSRPSWARLPLLKNHNLLGLATERTLYLGRLGGVDCWAAEAARETPARLKQPARGRRLGVVRAAAK